MPTLADKSAIVVGASRGLGRGVAQSLSAVGASVLAIARGQTDLAAGELTGDVAYLLTGDAGLTALPARR